MLPLNILMAKDSAHNVHCYHVKYMIVKKRSVSEHDVSCSKGHTKLVIRFQRTRACRRVKRWHQLTSSTSIPLVRRS